MSLNGSQLSFLVQNANKHEATPEMSLIQTIHNAIFSRKNIEMVPIFESMKCCPQGSELIIETLSRTFEAYSAVASDVASNALKIWDKCVLEFPETFAPISAQPKYLQILVDSVLPPRCAVISIDAKLYVLEIIQDWASKYSRFEGCWIFEDVYKRLKESCIIFPEPRQREALPGSGALDSDMKAIFESLSQSIEKLDNLASRLTRALQENDLDQKYALKLDDEVQVCQSLLYNVLDLMDKSKKAKDYENEMNCTGRALAKLDNANQRLQAFRNAFKRPCLGFVDPIFAYRMCSIAVVDLIILDIDFYS
ncbi:hypothetical protein Aperf_G00000083476 [Anoplocephala perfoliata]